MFRKGASLSGWFTKASSSTNNAASASEKPTPPTNLNDVPENWSEHKSEQGEKYYYNEKTGESTWVRPEVLGPEKLDHKQTQKEKVTQAMEQKKYEQAQRRRRLGDDDAYFEEDDDDQSKPGVNGFVTAADRDAAANPFADDDDEPKPSTTQSSAAANDDDDDEEDPLDAFMADIAKTVTKEKKTAGVEKKKPRRDDIENEDDQDTFFEVLAKRKAEGGEEEIVDYDENGYPIMKKKESLEEPIPPKDHSKVKYMEITKDFYEEHEDIKNLNPQEANMLRKKMAIRASGLDVPKPVASFVHFGFDSLIMKGIQKLGYATPTAIQAQAVPAALSGRDVIGIAKTGSGKTAAFVWPMITHIMDQPELEIGDGPIGVIVAPTRELVLQIMSETNRFAKYYKLHLVAVYGGGNRYEQTKAIKEGAEILVATPGRLIDLLKDKAVSMTRASYLVLDEADRMFSMGFEPQVRSIVNQIRPDRQTLLFSATFQKRVERLAREILLDPVRIVIGEVGEANMDITQIVTIMSEFDSKWNWLTERMVQFISAGSLLIFVTKKANADTLAQNLKSHGYPETLLLHGDMDQSFRNQVIADFKKEKSKILVATDVAARGLDIPAVRTVVNFDIARDIDTHTHRIGRTGRAGNKGTAHTLITEKEFVFAGHLVRNLEQAGQAVSPHLMDLANKDPHFGKRKRGRGGGRHEGGRGRGGRNRAGLGHTGYRAAPQTSDQAANMSGKKKGGFSNVSAMRSQFTSSFQKASSQSEGSWVKKASAVSGFVPQQKPVSNFMPQQAPSSFVPQKQPLAGFVPQQQKPPQQQEQPGKERKRRRRWD
eukprot:m.88221 g.88221  ORF g.88221 m.88221 type:complete len:824 (+) comp13153_c0_seq2:148-2619(+)